MYISAPLPLLVVFLLSKIGNFDPPSPSPLRRHSLWTAPYIMYTLVSTLSRQRKEGFAHIFIIDFGHCSSQIHAGFFYETIMPVLKFNQGYYSKCNLCALKVSQNLPLNQGCDNRMLTSLVRKGYLLFTHQFFGQYFKVFKLYSAQNSIKSKTTVHFI